MHDMGKLSSAFQNQMHKKINRESIRREEYFRHELLSFVYMVYSMQEYIQQSPDDFPYYLYAVLSHHKKLDANFKSFDRERNMSRDWPELTLEEYKYGINLVNELNSLSIDLIDEPKNFKFKRETVLKYIEYYTKESYFFKVRIV